MKYLNNAINNVLKMSKKTTIALCISAIAIALILSGCTQSTVKPIKAGIVIPLTGGAAVYGSDIQKALEIAKEDLKNDNVQIIYEDACLAPEALKAAQKLVMADETDFISGVFCIPSVFSITPITAPLKSSVMMTATVPSTIIESNSYVFSPNAAIADEATFQAEYAYNVLHAKTAGIIWMNSDFGKGYSDTFAKRFSELGGSIVYNSPIEFSGSDYRTDLNKVAENKPDMILAVHFGTQMGLILKQKMELNVTAQFMGTYESEDQYIIDSANGGAEGLLLSSPVGGSTGKAYADFRTRFEQKYGKNPTVVATMAYDGLTLQVKSFKKCGGDKNCILNELHNVKDYDGASGIFSITPEGTGKRTFVIKQVQDGKYVIV